MKLGFFKSAAVLTFTGFLLRGLGMLFRIYISGRIGEEGMGVYQLISSAYFLFITVAQSGLAVTVTALCSKRIALEGRGSARRVVKNALGISLVLGLSAALLMSTSAPFLTKYWMGEPRALLSLRVLSLSLPFMSVCAIFSGYFIACGNVLYGCSAQVIEQITRLILSAGAIKLFGGAELYVLLAALFFANTLSEAISCFYLSICYAYAPSVRTTDRKRYTRELITGAYPVALTRYLVSALHTAENMLAPSAIAIYTGTRESALADFGALKGMALPLMFFPFSFLSALSTLLLPKVTSALAVGESARARDIVSRTCHITLTLSAMIAGLFFLLSDPISDILYKSERVGFILRVLSPVLPFMYLDSICDGLLKAYGRQKKVFYNNCIDSVLRITLISLLAPRLGLTGFIIMMVFSNITVSLLNFRALITAAELKNHVFYWWIAPFFVSGMSAIITKFFLPFGATLPKILLTAIVFCLIFGVFIMLFNKNYKKYKNN